MVEWLAEWDVKTVQQMGWAGVSNGNLLRRAEVEFDLFLTADKRLRYRQNLKGRRLAIVVLPSNRLKVLRPVIANIELAITGIVHGRTGPISRTRTFVAHRRVAADFGGHTSGPWVTP